MAAGLGFIEFTTGSVLTAAQANGYLASQVVMVFADSAARTSAIASPQEGMVSYLKNSNSIEYYSGSAWVAIGGGAPAFSGVAVNRSSDLSTPNGTVTTVTFDSEIYDTDSYHSTSTNSERLTVPAGKSGYYLWNTQGAWASNTTGLRQFIFYKNGTRLNTPPGYESITSSSGFAEITRSYVLNLTAGDYVEVRAFQNSGGTLNIRADELQMSLTYLGA